MGDTAIEWADKVWNPVTGCTKVSAGCKFCYAERIFPRPYPGRAFTDVRCHPERLEQPMHWRKPSRIFVNSMSDLFHESVPASFIVSCFEVMAAASQHTYLILTKRPERIEPVLFGEEGGFYLGGGDFYPHIFLGVSVEDQKTADERIPKLLSVGWMGANFVSYEPALGPVEFQGGCRAWLKPDKLNPGDTRYPLVHWIIAGGESGPKARPSNLAWYRSVRDQCKTADVKYFMKQLGAHPWTHIDGGDIPFRIRDHKGGNPEEWPEDLIIREFPEVKR